MRALQLAAVGAFVEGFDLQRIVRAAIAPAMRRYFSFGDSHCGTCSLNSSNIDFEAALGQALCRCASAPEQPVEHAAKARAIANFRARCKHARPVLARRWD